MSLISHEVCRSDLIGGDHIYVYRVGGTYSHQGIYVGNDRVIHFNNDRKLPRSCSNPGCGFRKPGSGVFKSCLDCFLNNNRPRRYQYGVSGIESLFKIRAGTYTDVKSDPPEIVIDRAEHLLHNGFSKYHLMKNNCEDFALYCKTGLDVSTNGEVSSGQVRGFYNAGWFLVPGLVLSFVTFALRRRRRASDEDNEDEEDLPHVLARNTA